MSQTMADFDQKLDDEGTGPKMKTPEQMLENPNDYMPEGDKSKQRKLDSTWEVAEGGGSHDSSIIDNDSTQKK